MQACDRRVIGVFLPGVNAPVDVQEMQKMALHPSRHIQLELIVDDHEDKLSRLVWIQYLLDCKLKEKRLIMFNLYKLSDRAPTDRRLTNKEIKSKKTCTKVSKRSDSGNAITRQVKSSIIITLNLRLIQLCHTRLVM